MEAKRSAAIIGGVSLLLAVSVAVFFCLTDGGETGRTSPAFNGSTFRTRAVDKFNGVVKDILTYRGVGFRGSQGDMWFFISQWSIYGANASTGTLEWSFPSRGSSRLAVDNDLLFFGGYDGGYAVRIHNGELLWNFAAAGQCVSHAPTVSNDIVYFGSDAGAVFAVERETGKQLWSFDAEGELAGSPVAFGNLLLLLLDRSVAAIGPAGRKRWEVEFEFGHPRWAGIVGDVACIRSSGAELYGVRKDGTVVFKTDAETDPIVQGAVLYYGLTDGSVEGYDSTALKTIWTSALGSRLACDPLLHAGTLFCVTVNGTLFALAPGSGEQLWSHNIAKPVGSVALAAGDSYVCVLAHRERLYAVDIATGQDRWTQELSYGGFSTHVEAVDQTVLVNTPRGELRALDADTGNDIWRAPHAKRRVVWAGHVVGGNLIYFSGVDGAFHCADIHSGSEKWSLRPPGIGVEYSPVLSESIQAALCATTSGRVLLVPFDLERRATEVFQTDGPLSCSPFVDGDLFYFGHDNGLLECRELKDKVWDFRANGSIAAPPVVSEGYLYFGSEAGLLYKVNAKEGDLLWTFETGGPIRASPAVGGDTVYVGSSDGHVYAVSVAGKELWRSRVSGAVVSSPASDGKALFVGDSTGNFFALSLESGEDIWSSQIGAPVSSSVGLYGNKVYFGCGNGSFYALDAANGSESWRVQTAGSVVSAPSIAGGIVYFGCDDGFLYAADADSGNIKWQFKTGGPVASPPAVRDGRLYLGSKDGFIYIIH